MEVLHPRCAGLDVHSETVVSCVRIQEKGRARHEVRTFATTTKGLVALRDWLVAEGVTDAVMERIVDEHLVGGRPVKEHVFHQTSGDASPPPAAPKEG